MKSKEKSPGTEGIDQSSSLAERQILHRMLQDDSGHDYFVYLPGNSGRDSPVFVAVHDISRDAREQVEAFSAECERRGALLVAPHFAVEQYPNYQRLGRSRHSSFAERKADTALDSILEEVASLTGVSTARIHLFGYGAGGRFAMRYAMGHPDRVAAVVIASPGTYTFPDAKKSFPQGIAEGRGRPDLRFELEQFLRVPMTLLEGRQG
ncbi:MAG: dienelactone hydrolase family protein, partial [Deltaproteobacteria bacterium]|nr:dienelactone hydrolase family protein [Deltaproteobacteria bacterium]